MGATSAISYEWISNMLVYVYQKKRKKKETKRKKDVGLKKIK